LQEFVDEHVQKYERYRLNCCEQPKPRQVLGFAAQTISPFFS
jgi:hypothetical protein